jgi:hypothetical protein
MFLVQLFLAVRFNYFLCKLLEHGVMPKHVRDNQYKEHTACRMLRFSRSWFRASSFIKLNKNQLDAPMF